MSTPLPLVVSQPNHASGDFYLIPVDFSLASVNLYPPEVSYAPKPAELIACYGDGTRTPVVFYFVPVDFYFAPVDLYQPQADLGRLLPESVKSIV